MQQPVLRTHQIVNMCLGFMGIQFGFALQNANVSRIFQTLGANMDELAILWIAAPLTGLLIQPIIGYYSDRTWTRWGRRRPFFFAGALLSAIALFIMPNSPALWIAVVMLWLLDAAINTSMEPFRAYVGDNLAPKQRPLGYALQSFFIGVGAVIASSLPWLLTALGVSNDAAEGELPNSVIYSFYFGGVVFFSAVLYTIVTSDEYTPEQLAKFNSTNDERVALDYQPLTLQPWQIALLVSGLLLGGATYVLGWNKELWVLVGLFSGGFVLFAVAGWLQRRGADNMVVSLANDIAHMPPMMRRLAVVQFFTWFALFSMWIYTTSAVTGFHFGSSDVSSALYNEGANWVGVLFSAYNGVGMLAALLLPLLARKIGTPKTHALALILGGVGLMSFYVITDPQWLLASMVLVGIAWASILSLPYALLSNCLPSHKMGTYMGIFNLFIVIPQLIAASILGLLISQLFDNQPIFAMVIGGVSFLVAAASLIGFNDDSQVTHEDAQ
jgi:maltose/moltooligosaccharide transporter